MYFEEKVMNGWLYYRTSPNGEWHAITPAQLLGRYQEEKRRAEMYFRLLTPDQIEEVAEMQREAAAEDAYA